MAITVILLCLALQRYLHCRSSDYRFDWMTPYYQFLQARIPAIQETNPYVALAIIVVPLLLIAGLLTTLIAQVLGLLGSYVFSVLVLWFFLDARDAAKVPYEPNTPANIFTQSYREVFVLLFWFFLLKVPGVILYISVSELRKYLSDNSAESSELLLTTSTKVLAVLDWVPQRLLGLTFAMVGNFSLVFKDWAQGLTSGLDQESANVVRWGEDAIADADTPVPTASEQALVSSSVVWQALALVERALLFWLVVMAIFTIGFWVGLL